VQSLKKSQFLFTGSLFDFWERGERARTHPTTHPTTSQSHRTLSYPSRCCSLAPSQSSSAGLTLSPNGRPHVHQQDALRNIELCKCLQRCASAICTQSAPYGATRLHHHAQTRVAHPTRRRSRIQVEVSHHSHVPKLKEQTQRATAPLQQSDNVVDPQRRVLSSSCQVVCG
jgi:hypothetical protein